MSSLGTGPLVIPFVLIGFSDQVFGSITLPFDLSFLGWNGCTLYTDILSAETMNRIGAGAHWSLEVPADPGLGGLDFWLQNMTLDPAAAGGVAFSNAGHGHVGLR